jgi:hypothetical protein
MSFSINGIPIIENIGTVGLYSGATDPSGWVICDGQPRINTTGTYDNLFLQTTGKNYGYGPSWTNYGISSSINTPSGSITLTDVRGVAVSDVGTVVLADRASTGLFISQNNGATFSTISSESLPAISFSCVDISTDGSDIIAAANVVGYGLYLSTNGGSNWTQLYTANGLPTDLVSMDNGSNKVAISNDGTKIAVAYTNGFTYFSSNSGATFKVVSPPTATGTSLLGQNVAKNYWGLGMSKDGTKLVTAVNNGSLIPDFTKTSFVTNPGTGLPTSATYGQTAISYSGQYQAVTQSSATAGIWISTNYGNNWKITTGYGIGGGFSTSLLSMSGNGQYIGLTNSSNFFTISSTYGENFRVTTLGNMNSAFSYTGQYIVCGRDGSTHFSTNYGNSFINHSGARCGGCGISSTGQYMVFASINAVFVSSNYGASFQSPSTGGSTNIGQVAVSGSGQYMFMTGWASNNVYVSSTYGAAFYIAFSNSNSNQAKQAYISYTGQFMFFNGYYSSNYGVSWVSGIAGSHCSVNATCQYILNSGSTVQLANFPYPSNSLNNITKSWSKISGNGLPTTAGYQYIQYSYTGKYVLLATTNQGPILSTNYGNNWLTTNSGISWPAGAAINVYQVGVSSSGQYMTAVNGKALLSTNYGYNWKQHPGGLSSNPTWQETAISGNGQYVLFMTSATSVIWLSSTSGSNFYQLTNMPARNLAQNGPYEQVCISNDGQYIFFSTGQAWPWLSTSFGQFWTEKPGTGLTGNFQFFGPAGMSLSGQYILVMQQGGSGNGNWWVSSNYGANWKATSGTPGSNGYYSGSVSASGQYMAISGSFFYFSNNYGVTWTSNPGSVPQFSFATISPNAQYMLTAGNGTLYGSNFNGNGFSYWLQQNTTVQALQNYRTLTQLGNANWRAFVFSANGQYMLITRTGGSSYISSNYGQTFSALSLAGSNFYSCCISYSGQYMIIAEYNSGTPSISTTYGISWYKPAIFTTSTTYNCTKISGNGQYMLAGTNSPGTLYISTDFGNNWSSNPGGIPVNGDYQGGGISYTGQYMYAGKYISSNYGNSWRLMSYAPTLAAGEMSGTGQYILIGSDVNAHLSTDYGNTFTSKGINGYPAGGMSYSGQYITLGRYYSINYGATFSSFPVGTQSSGVSANGYFFGSVTYGGGAYLFSVPAQNVDGGISYSTDSGNNWLAGGNLNGPYFNSVAISGDGTTILAGYQNDALYVSTGGSNKFNYSFPSIPQINAYGLALSSTGQNAIVTQQGGSVFTSTSFGANFTSGTVSGKAGQYVTDQFYGAASISQNGQVAAAAANGVVYTSTSVNTSGEVAFSTGVVDENNQTFSTQFGTSYSTFASSTITSQNWANAATSSNGQYMLATSNSSGNGFLYLSTNSGAFWSEPLGTGIAYQLAWNGCAISPSTNNSGYYVMAASVSGGSVYVSINSGATWTIPSTLPTAAWSSISMDTDGSIIAVIASGSQIYISTNMGTTFTAYGSALAYTDIAVSLTGQYMTATVSGGQIYVSTSFGTTWTPYGPTADWLDIHMSGAANIMVAAVNNGPLYISTNTGQAWTTISTTNNVLPTSANWGNVGISSDGTQLVATIQGGAIYTSTNGGAFWSNVQTTVTGSSATTAWSNCLAMSGNGSTIVAGQSNVGGSGLLYVSINTLFTKTINTSTWIPNSIPASINVQSGSITLTDVRGIATSDVGTVVLADRAGRGLYISQNNGLTWGTVSSATLPSISFSCVDISADGTKIVAAANVIGQGLFLSTNTGSTWSQLYTQNGLPTDLISMDNGSNKVAISNDGTKIAVAYTNGFVYYSSNSGSTFKIVSPFDSTGSGSTISIPKNYWGLGMSKDGSKIVTAVNNGSLAPNFSNLSSLFVTTPGIGLAASANYGHSSISYNGQYQAIGVSGSGVYVSANYGTTWTFTSGFCTGGGVGYSITAMSATGQYIYGMVGGATGTFCYSSNYGVNWINTATSLGGHGCRQISCSATGQYVLVPIDAAGANPCLLSSTYGTSFYNISTTSVPTSRYGGGAVSGTGQYMVVVSLNYNGYSSSNYGVNWTLATGSASFSGGRVYASGSGQYFVMFGWLGSAPYISSTYGRSFYASSGSSTSDVYGGISYTGQYMITNNQYSMNYGVNWTAITNMTFPCISAYGEYVLAISVAGEGSVKLAKLPYWANGQNYVTKFWTTKTALPTNGNYSGVSLSYTGQYQSACSLSGYLYISSDFGNSWKIPSTLSSTSSYMATSISKNGQYIVASSSSFAGVYLSTSFGNSFTAITISGMTSAQGCCISQSGKYIIVGTNGKSIYLSSSFGSNWIPSANISGLTATLNINFPSISENGDYILIVNWTPGTVWLSSNSGNSFYSIPFFVTANKSAGSATAVSNTGQYMIVNFFDSGYSYLSTSYGINWNTIQTTISAAYASISENGQFMILSAGGSNSTFAGNAGSGAVYYSTNYGSSFINDGLPRGIGYFSAAISGNAQYALVGAYPGSVYSSTYKDQPWLQQNQVGYNWITSSLTGNSGGCAMSANGQYMLTDTKYISTDYGTTFNSITDSNISSLSGFSCAMSYSGQYMIIGNGGTGKPYISTNYGVNWNTNSTFSNNTYRLVAISGNGQYMLCGTFVAGTTIYMSSNFGNNWITNPGTGISSSKPQVGGISYNGQYMFITGCLSTNYGVNWTANSNLNGTDNGSSGNMSGNGQVIFASGHAWQAGSSKISTDYGKTFFTISFGVSGYNTMGISYTGQYMFSWGYLSTSYGVNWTLYSNINPGGITNSVNGAAISADGNYVLNVTTGGYFLSRPLNVDGGVAYSTDSGNNWTNGRNINGPNYSSVTISADGSTVLAGTQNGFPAISNNTTNSFSMVSSIIPPVSTYGMSLSSTGQTAIITQQGGSIFTSTSFGSNWTSATVTGTNGQSIYDQFYGAASISQNGLVAGAAANGVVYTSTTANTSGQVSFSTGAGYTFNANNSNFSTQTGTSYSTFASQSITTQAWLSVSISSNGQVMAACSSNSAGGYVYLSNNSGTTWTASTTLSTSQLNFSSVALSQTGQYILASVTSGNLYVSANTGSSWTTISSVPVQSWTDVFVSSTGQVMVAVGTAIQPYVSTNFGTTWSISTLGSAQNYSAVTTSATGQYIAASASGGQIYLSTNTGTNWSVLSNSTTANWTSISMSGTGQIIIASANGPVNAQSLYLSNNFGLTWTSLNNISALPNNGSWSGVSISTDGLRIVATTNTGYIYTSINAGTTWTVSTSTADAPRPWQFVAISGDGSKAIAITNPGQVYTSTDGQVLTFTPITMPTTTTLDGTQLRYITKI